jgi:class 3 adenylate cyclase/pimeloyl-ACP methyl ester carboxylesterase
VRLLAAASFCAALGRACQAGSGRYACSVQRVGAAFAVRDFAVVDDVRYLSAAGYHVAYRVRGGAADRDVVLFTPGGTIPMDFLERDRIGARLLDGLAAIGRLILFDRRGIGLSDPITDWSIPLVEQWAEDLLSVVDAACRCAPVVVCLGDYWGPARLFAGNHPQSLAALVLYEPTGPVAAVDLAGAARDLRERGHEASPETDWIARVCASRADDRAFRDWFDAAGRTGASPAVAARIYGRPPEQTVQLLAGSHSTIEVPTLVLRRPQNLMGSPSPPDPVSTEIRLGQRVDLPGTDYHWLGEDIDSLLAEISRFVLGEARLPRPERELCAVVFTDLVGSTQHAAAAGDERWKTILDRHDEVIHQEISRNGGVVVKSTGDGVLATLPSADRALRAAENIRARLAGDALSTRIGIHVGDVERRGTDLAGVGVHIASRVMALAGSGEILVTESVPIAATGSAHEFEIVGERELKGVSGRTAS